MNKQHAILFFVILALLATAPLSVHNPLRNDSRTPIPEVVN